MLEVYSFIYLHIFFAMTELILSKDFFIFYSSQICHFMFNFIYLYIKVKNWKTSTLFSFVHYTVIICFLICSFIYLISRVHETTRVRSVRQFSFFILTRLFKNFTHPRDSHVCTIAKSKINSKKFQYKKWK